MFFFISFTSTIFFDLARLILCLLLIALVIMICEEMDS